MITVEEAQEYLHGKTNAVVSAKILRARINNEPLYVQTGDTVVVIVGTERMTISRNDVTQEITIVND